jgi:glyoxylase-like metal-dependent hydrolase (beta-lactamase superfamily II)
LKQVKINHLNCGTLSPKYPRSRSIVYCLLVETEDGPVLVDTGFGFQDYEKPTLMMDGFLKLMGVPRKSEETAIYHAESLGYDPQDVKHIVLTHLHLDHAGGMRDFPHAQIHLFKTELESATHPHSLLERGCDSAHWAHDPKWVFYDQVDGEWFGFPRIDILEGISPQICLVPLPGHTRGHCGVAVATDRGWIFNCGDAANPSHKEVDIHGHAADKQSLIFLPGWVSFRFCGPHVPALRRLVKEHRNEVSVFSSHDIYSFEKNLNSA